MNHVRHLIFYLTIFFIAFGGHLQAQDSQRSELKNAETPFLRRHADHPVKWRRWSTEVFKRARKKDKLLFLSIGYGSSYWGHRMEEENYKDPEVAEVLNNQYVNVVVDRDLRPDILNTFSEAADLLGRQPSWPMVVVMTPDRQPVRIFSYRPKKIQGRTPGFLSMVKSLAALWKTENERMLQFSSVVSNTLQTYDGSAPGPAPDQSILGKTLKELSKRYDQKYAGFGKGAKFPAPHNLLYLLSEVNESQSEKARTMLEKTLNRMRNSALYDHLNSGFHRFTVDRQWTDPQFEKRLDTQALMIYLYARAYQLTEDPLFRRTVEELISFIRTRMMGQNGNGAYTSVDSTGWSGRRDFYYTWTLKEIRDVLSEELANLVIQSFNVVEKGNYNPKHMKAGKGLNVLYPGTPLEKRAREHDMSVKEYRKKIDVARKKLLEARRQRKRPAVDERVMTSSNGLLIAALATAGRLLDESDYVNQASQLAGFLDSNLRSDEGLLYRQYWNGQSSGRAFLYDYASFAWGLTELYRSTKKESHLSLASQIVNEMKKRFGRQGGGFYDTTVGDAPALNRFMHLLDGSHPSGNSIAANALANLARLTDDSSYMKSVHRIGAAFSKKISSNPSSYTMFLLAYRNLFRKPFIDIAQSDVKRTEGSGSSEDGTEKRKTALKRGDFAILQHSPQALRDVLAAHQDRVRVVIVLAPS